MYKFLSKGLLEIFNKNVFMFRVVKEYYIIIYSD